MSVVWDRKNVRGRRLERQEGGRDEGLKSD